MAMTTCSECGKELSTTASACPHCGAKFKKPSGCLLVFVAAIAVLFLIGIATDKPPPVKTPDQVVQDAKKEAAFQRVVGALHSIKRANRNPASVEWESVRANDTAFIICVEYRGQNGFGGMSREFVVYVNNTPSQSKKDWNAHCVQPLTDMIHARRAL